MCICAASDAGVGLPMWLGFVFISGWLVIACLRHLGAELVYAVKSHKLQVDAERLRAQQHARLKKLEAVSHRRAA